MSRSSWQHFIIRSAAVFTAAFSILTVCQSGAFAQAAAPVKLRIASTRVFTYAPLLLAKELGYFQAEGLDVDMLETQSGVATASALLGGSVVAAGSGYIQPLQLAEQGKSLKTLSGIEMASIYVFVASPKMNISTDNPAAMAAALKGKRFGVASLGSTGDVIAQGVLAEQGLSSKDVTYVAIGTGATALAALKTGAVDAIITYEPDLATVLESGAGKIVLDLRKTKTEKTYSRLPTTTLQATSEWIDKNPEIAAKIVRAVARANKTLREDAATSLGALVKIYPTVPKATLESIYEASRGNFQSQVAEDQFKFAQDLYLKTNQVKKAVPYASVVATQFRQYWNP